VNARVSSIKPENKKEVFSVQNKRNIMAISSSACKYGGNAIQCNKRKANKNIFRDTAKEKDLTTIVQLFVSGCDVRMYNLLKFIE